MRAAILSAAAWSTSARTWLVDVAGDRHGTVPQPVGYDLQPNARLERSTRVGVSKTVDGDNRQLRILGKPLECPRDQVRVQGPSVLPREGQVAEPVGAALRFQMLTVRSGKVVDIVGFDDKAEALSYFS